MTGKDSSPSASRAAISWGAIIACNLSLIAASEPRRGSAIPRYREAPVQSGGYPKRSHRSKSKMISIHSDLDTMALTIIGPQPNEPAVERATVLAAIQGMDRSIGKLTWTPSDPFRNGRISVRTSRVCCPGFDAKAAEAGALPS